MTEMFCERYRKNCVQMLNCGIFLLQLRKPGYMIQSSLSGESVWFLMGARNFCVDSVLISLLFFCRIKLLGP